MLRLVIYDPYSRQMQEDPYPTYRYFRDEEPCTHNPQMDFYALFRFEDVWDATLDWKTYSSSLGPILENKGEIPGEVMSIIGMDPPRHVRIRNLVSKGFTPRRIRELEPRVTEIAVQHLETALQSDTFDYVDEFAGKLPMDVISELMGVPEPDRARIRALADGVMHRDEGVPDVPASAMHASADLMVYYAGMVAERRKTLSDDLTSALLDAEIDGDRLADDEIMAFLFLMVVAGNETTTKLLANAAYWGYKNPDQLAAVYKDHSKIPLWVEETLRYDTSSQILARTVAGELTLHDTTLPDGTVLLLLPGSANRDDRVFEDADEYRIGRDIGSKLVSFGSGAHFCLGAHLARMEARVALTELFKRIRGYEVDEANAVRVHSSNVRGFAHLPMTVEAA